MDPVSDNVLVAIIITVGTVLAALLSYLGIVATGARRHAKAARNQVQNSHDTNLRDDLDTKFAGLAVLVKGLVLDVGGMKSDIRGIRRDASDDRRAAGEAIAAEREHIRKLEQTLTPAQIERLRIESEEQQ